jgi:hypothetical protein
MLITEYNDIPKEGGVEERKMLKAKYTDSLDMIDFYNDDGYLFSVCETTKNNIVDAINLLYDRFDDKGNLRKEIIEKMEK